jgi:hypothetical protein
MSFSDPSHAPHGLVRTPVRRGLLPPATLPIALVLLLLGINGPNLLLALLSIAVLIAGCLLLWRPGEPPVLLFTFAYPWLQASVSIFHANWLGIDVADYTPYHQGDMPGAIVMSLLGLLALAVGVRLGAGPRRAADVLAVREVAWSQPIKLWFQLYALAWAISFMALSFAWVLPGLSQPMMALSGMRWVFFFLLGVACFTQGKGLSGLFLAAFALELATGLGTYFADFKTVFVITFFAALASGNRISSRALLGAGVVAILVIGLAIVWTAVKEEYRIFVSGGQTAQIVAVDLASRLAKLYELATNLDAQSLSNAVDQLLRRLTYVEFFSVVLTYVPANIPHTFGTILWDAILRPFMPRLLFADKDVIDDTARTNLFTGGLAGSSAATSISLGYIAEAYIDFGSVGMFAVLIGIGLFYGSIYRWFSHWRRSQGPLGMAVASAALVSVGAMENSFTKVFGSVVVSLLVATMMIIFIVPRWAPWLVRPYARLMHR